ncbi:ATP-dependent helicase [Candidatus Saccharibacteria bacterium]|nr:ATP-dependent helicase [Candidatus Saccharibacteria bacterium]
MPLNENQKKAVEYLDGPLLVLAGPGTGKTQLLSEKVAYILKHTDTNPENILCLTFTDAGAMNMRERLKTVIGQDALKVNIGTYHAFGSEILAQYKNYSEDYNRQLDSPIDEITEFKIIKEIQDNLPGNDILRGDKVKDIMGVISEAKKAGLTEDDLVKIAKKNMEDSEILSNAISPLLLNVVPYKFKESLEGAYKPIHELLKDYSDLKPITKNIERSIAAMARELNEAMATALDKGSVGALSKWKDDYFEKDEKGNYRLKDRIRNKKLLSVANVMKQYQDYLNENGLFDFNDMIEEAVRILNTNTGFKLTLEERYQFILLDEFQDTNPSQFAIVKAITDYEKPNIMAVGDDDQAIFEFQGALSSNLSDYQKYYSAEVIPLVENYRSTQEVLDFARKIINQAPDRFADKELIAHKEPLTKSGLHRIEFLSSDQEYGFVADKISELVKSGVKQNEIAVISYKTKYFEPLLPYLKEHEEIKIAYEKRDDLFLDDKIHQIISIIRYIDEMARQKVPSVQIMEILSYPFFKVPMVEVIRLIGQARVAHESAFDYLAKSEDEAVADAMAFLADLVAKTFTEPLDIIIDAIVKKMDIDSLDAYERFIFYDNLASLKGKIARHFGEKQLKASDLVELVDDYTSANMPLTVTSPYRDADEAVQILTAHKAKGLEFEYVFILTADHSAWGSGKGNNNLLLLPNNLTQIRHTGMTDGERIRILYVALTRAKHTIYITNALHDYNNKEQDRLEYFAENIVKVDGEEKLASPYLPSGFGETRYAIPSVEVREKSVKNWVSSYVDKTPDVRLLYKERIKNWKMSASALTSFIDIVYAGPQSFFKSYVLNTPREPETESLVTGTLMHSVFEAVTNKGISNDEAIQLFLEELDKYDVESQIKQKIREKGPEYLLVALNEFGDILKNGEAEVNLGPDKLVVDGIPVTGKVDHITIDEENKTIEIYDFKTSQYHSNKWRSHNTLYKYMLQLEFYKLLLKNSPRYSKYKIEKAHILFVIPDNDGLVYDKEYIFNDDDEAELHALMQAVYKQVMSLDFIDDPELFVEPNTELGIKDIMKFIELLLAKSAK